MSWALKGLAGPLKDAIFPLKSGITLGRQGDVAITDVKSSAIHARIIHSQHGNWILQDNSSKNGTRIQGERITTAQLSVGLTFYIGDQGFEVVEFAEKKPDLKRDKKQRYWYELLARFLAKGADRFAEHPRPVAPFEPSLILEFVRGIQTNSHWVLGYGPRKIGPSCLDLPIWEPGAPSVCFEIFPSPDGIVFKTAHPDTVRLNGQGVDSEVLRVGDTIRILETFIEVDFGE